MGLRKTSLNHGMISVELYSFKLENQNVTVVVLIQMLSEFHGGL